ncbi:MAG: hypothetical protein JWO02_2502 [Solirubrobacterales bacterium]|nr:hypothetical protein [Solirubrobacterales bacterium]
MNVAAVPPMPIRDAPEAALIVYTTLMIAVTAGFLVYWFVSPAERRAGPALPLILLGGVLSGLMESWLDNVVLVGYPPDQNLPVLEAFGRSVPMFVPIGYGWFCGGLLYLVARAYRRGITAAKVWQLYAAVAVVDFVAIGLSSWIGILEFYGGPPMKVLGYPLWWAGIDGLDVVLGGAIVFVLLPHLRGRSQAWLVLVPSIALGASAGIVGWPISTALSSDWSMGAKYACAVASIALSLACVHFVTKALPILAGYLRGDATISAPTSASVPGDATRGAGEPGLARTSG